MPVPLFMHTDESISAAPPNFSTRYGLTKDLYYQWIHREVHCGYSNDCLA